MKFKMGFTALISIILISGFLMVSILEASYEIFSNYRNVFRSIDKIASQNSAKSCLQLSFLYLRKNENYQPDTNMNTDPPCQITSITKDSVFTIKAVGFYTGAKTLIEGHLDEKGH